MSKYFVAFGPVLLSFLLILQSFNNCAAQDISAVITIKPGSTPGVEVSGHFNSVSSRNFAIVREYAGISGLASRISNVRLEDKAGNVVAHKQFIPGEYVAESDFASWHYEMDLKPASLPAAAAHVSWLTGSGGLLRLFDLLPVLPVKKDGVTADVKFVLPDGWHMSTAASGFQNVVIESAVALVGTDLRDIGTADSTLRIVAEGDWKFSDADSDKAVREIYGEYARLFGGRPNGNATILLVHFPQSVGFGSWEGDTRGSTVTIVSSDMPFQTQAIQRLHEQLRHEIFHLWFPNAVKLRGNYDWFYEGFALYQSLRTGVSLGRIRFDDMLDTLSRAYTIDTALTLRQSLIDASKNRTTGGDTDLYARGMIIAFLTDLELLRSSNGTRDVSWLLRSIFERFHDSKTAVDGNDAVLATIGNQAITNYVKGTAPIDLTADLEAAGLEAATQNSVTTFRVVPKPDRRQREMLDKLGYNDWRKSNASPK